MRAAAGLASVLAIAVLLHATGRAGPLVSGAPLLVDARQVCEREDRCESLTGCVIPNRPAGPALEALPRRPDYDQYVLQLAAFQACRERALKVKARAPARTDILNIAFRSSEAEEKAFADTVVRWNGDIFWEPASQSTNVVTRFGDEARAVFGPIPGGYCGGPDAKIVPREVDGNIVDLIPNPAKPGSPLEFRHADHNGDVIKWTTTLPKCDKPSLTGSATYCGLNTRISRVVRGNVEWLFLCRKSHYSHEVSTDPYWLKSDPRFSLFGAIGYNSQSGEIAFFDGRKDRHGFDWSKPFVPPAGRSYSDFAGRAEAAAFYDPTFQIACHACHDNKNPYVIDPHIAQGRVGYRDGQNGPKAVAFSLGEYLPRRPRLPGAPFRVIGSAYTGTYRVDLKRARTVQDPSGNCTGCHTLTTQVTGQRLAPDAVSREPAITYPTWSQLLHLSEEKKIYAAVDAHRTDWARAEGGIHPWMAPLSGNDLASNGRRISAEDWRRLSDCLWDAGGDECGYRPLYTRCPAPESKGEGSRMAEAKIDIFPVPAGETTDKRMIRVGWTYLNSYGGVPERDDVRVDVAIKTVAIPGNGGPPASDAFPSVEEASGIDLESVQEQIGTVGSSMVIRNVSYAGHQRWSDPAPSLTPRDYRLDLPGKCNQRVLVRLLPKRFCFDQDNVAYSPEQHLAYADIVCD